MDELQGEIIHGAEIKIAWSKQVRKQNKALKGLLNEISSKVRGAYVFVYKMIITG